MTFPTPDLPPPVAALLDRAIARLRLAAPDPAQWPQAPDFEAGLRRLALASDFAIDTLCRQPELLAQLDAGAPLPLPVLDPLQPAPGRCSCAATAPPPPRGWSGVT